MLRIATLLWMILISSHSSSAMPVGKILFEYECKQFNTLGLNMSCNYDGPGSLVYVVHEGFEETEMAKYELAKLMNRFASHGGKNFRIEHFDDPPHRSQWCDVMDTNGRYRCLSCDDRESRCNVD